MNNRNPRRRCEICSKLKKNTPEKCHWGHTGVFNVNFEHISLLFLAFLSLILSMYSFARNLLFSFHNSRRILVEFIQVLESLIEKQGWETFVVLTLSKGRFQKHLSGGAVKKRPSENFKTFPGEFDIRILAMMKTQMVHKAFD